MLSASGQGLGGKAQGDAGAGFETFGRGRLVVGLGDASNEGETEAERPFAVRTLISALERLVQVVKARPSVFDLDENAVSCARELDRGDAPAVFLGVADQVGGGGLSCVGAPREHVAHAANGANAIGAHLLAELRNVDLAP